MTDRDTFAYAALAGRFTDFDAFEIADAMLRERCRSGGDCPLPDNAANHDASPEARASGDSDRTDKAAPRPSEGTGDTPKPINACVSDRPQPINGPDPDSRVWETPVHTPPTHATPGEGSVPREGTQEPAAWGVLRVGCRWVSILETPEQAETSRQSWDRMENWVHEVIPLYRQPPCQDFSQQNLTLTDAEREAIRTAAEAYAVRGAADGRESVNAATLRGLLERMGGGR